MIDFGVLSNRKTLRQHHLRPSPGLVPTLPQSSSGGRATKLFTWAQHHEAFDNRSFDLVMEMMDKPEGSDRVFTPTQTEGL